MWKGRGRNYLPSFNWISSAISRRTRRHAQTFLLLYLRKSASSAGNAFCIFVLALVSPLGTEGAFILIFAPNQGILNMLNLVLFGPPGSGKGTQAEKIIVRYNLIHLSTGDMLRAEIAAQTKLGLEAKTLMDKGELVPDAVVIGMIENKLDANKAAHGFVFDGFPRTVTQAEALDQLLAKRNTPIKAVLSLYVSEEELTKRILNRGKTSGRADDQDETIVKNRVAEYRKKTEPLAKYYEAQHKLKQIIGEGTVEEISALLFAEIEKVK